MTKKLFCLCLGALAVASLTLVSCDDEDDVVTSQEQPDEPDTTDEPDGTDESDEADTTDEPTLTFSVDEWNFPAKGELTANIEVTSDYDYEITNDADWLTAEVTADGVKLTAEENEAYEGRETEVVITVSNDEGKTVSKGITVTQDACAYIEMGETELSVASAGGTFSVSVDSNYEWTANVDVEWLTVESGDGGAVLTVSANTSTTTEREAVVTFSAGDGLENVAEAVLAITQDMKGTQMILAVNLTDDGATVKLPLLGTVSCDINWGDGSTTTETSTLPTHTYASAGEYDIAITGTVTQMYTDNMTSAERGYIVGVRQWGEVGLETMNDAFQGCSNLSFVPEDAEDAFVNVTRFNSVFYNCTSLTVLPEKLFGNCPKATTFEQAFYGCTGLESVPAGLFSGCPAVTVFTSVFNGCSNLKTVPEGLFDGPEAVENFKQAFRDCSSLESVPGKLFMNCAKDKSIEAFTYIFSGCQALTSLPEGLFEGCGTNTTFEYAFYNCSGLTNIPVSLFAGCADVTNYNSVFRGCSGLTSVPVGLFSDCGETDKTTFSYSFYNCTGLQTLDGDVFTGCESATNFADCFEGCSSLKSLPADLFSDCAKCTNFGWVFRNCTELTGESPYVEIGGEKVHLYERTEHTEYFPESISHTQAFNNCTKLDDHDAIYDAGWCACKPE